MQGDTFLRSAYVVFDLENEEISIAKALFNVTDSKIMEIGKGKGAVPEATAASSVVNVAPTGTGSGRNNNMPLASGDMTFLPGGFASETASHSSASSASASTIGSTKAIGSVLFFSLLVGVCSVVF